MRKSLRIGVIGEGEASEENIDLAYKVGKEIAKRGAIVVCGGLGGVMEAVCRGAKEGGGLTVGILPGEEEKEANPYVDIPIVTGFSHGRNIIVVRSSQAIIAIGGSYGTLSEIAFALKLEIPVIGLNTWEYPPKEGRSLPIIHLKDPLEAVLRAIKEAGG
jgi:hypothetical protein